MSNGRIEQVGTPSQVYNEPQNAFVYDFLGNYNAFEGWLDKHGEAHITEYEVTSDGSGNPKQAKKPGTPWFSNTPVISSVLHTLLSTQGLSTNQLLLCSS
jgi:ABC-type Fe3+/spermidine/putrescine transport system ATPase subunit